MSIEIGNVIGRFKKSSTLNLKKIKVLTFLILVTTSFALTQTTVNASGVSQSGEFINCPYHHQVVRVGINPTFCIKEIRTEDYELNLISHGRADDPPSEEGKSLVTITEIEDSYHFHVLDEEGNKVIDMRNNKSSLDKTLVHELNEAFSSQPITNFKKSEILQQITSNLNIARVESIRNNLIKFATNPSLNVLDLKLDLTCSITTESSCESDEFKIIYEDPRESRESRELIKLTKDVVKGLDPIDGSKRERIAYNLLIKIKQAIKKYRASSCKISSQAVRVNWHNELDLPLFCVKATVIDGESVFQRATRINDKLKEILDGTINVESLGIAKVSELKTELRVKPDFENINIQRGGKKAVEKNDDSDLNNSEALAIVSHKDKNSREVDVILIVTELDVKLSKTGYNNPSQAIDEYFSKIVDAVKFSDPVGAIVKFDWGPYQKFGFLFKQLFEPTIQEEKIFEVQGKASFYNESYRALKIENEIDKASIKSVLDIFKSPNLGIFCKRGDQENKKYHKIGNLADSLVASEETQSKYSGEELIIGKKNGKQALNIIMSITDEDRKVKEDGKESELEASWRYLKAINQKLEAYRCNNYLTLELFLACLSSYIYFTANDNRKKCNKPKSNRWKIFFLSLSSMLIMLHILSPLILGLSAKQFYLSRMWFIILALNAHSLVFQIYQSKGGAIPFGNSRKIPSPEEAYGRLKSFLRKIYFRKNYIYLALILLCFYLLPIDLANKFIQSLREQTNLRFKDLSSYITTQLPILLSIWIIGIGVLYIICVISLTLYNSVSYRRRSEIKWNILRGIDTHGEAIIFILGIFALIFLLAISGPALPGSGTVYFAGVTAVAGLIFTWSASAAIADFISGIILIFLTNLEEGDWVKIGNIEGKLKDQNLLVHHIKTTKNTIVTIPNANVLRNIAFNYTSSNRITNGTTALDRFPILHTTVTLGYEISCKQARMALQEAAELTKDVITSRNIVDVFPFEPQDLVKGRTNPKIRSEQSDKSNVELEDIKNMEEKARRTIEQCYKEFRELSKKLDPFVLVKSLDDFYVSYELNAFLNPVVCILKPELIPRIYSELHEKVHQVCSEKGIEILSPHYEAGRDGNSPAIPKELLDRFNEAVRSHAQDQQGGEAELGH